LKIVRRLGTGFVFALLLAVATASSALLVEGGYRAYLHRVLMTSVEPAPQSAQERRFVFYSKPEPWRFAAVGGFEFKEGRWMNGVIENGAFSYCEFFGEGNQYGGFGRVSEDWDRADLRVLLVGSSYTLTNENEQGVGELLRSRLAAALERRVSLINLSRDSTGVLTMFDIAADRIPSLRPDIVLFAFNTAAFGYRRHWREVRRISADTEALFLLKGPEPSAPRTRALPQGSIVSALTTPEWCSAMMQAKAGGDEKRLRDDPTVRRLVAAYDEYLSAVSRPPVVLDFLRTDISFMWNALAHGDPFKDLTVREEVSIFTPLTITDYKEDAAFMAALARVQSSGVPYLLLHIPALPEMQEGPDYYTFGRFGVAEEIERALAASLEDRTGHDIDHMWRRYSTFERSDPEALVQDKHNWHPSAAGEWALANGMAQSVLEQIRRAPIVRWEN